MPLSEAQHVLIIDDDEVFRTRLGGAFVQREWLATVAANGAEALVVLPAVPFQLILLDLRMPGSGGLEILQTLRTAHATAKIIVLTGYGSIPTTIAAMKLGADDYLSKVADTD